MNTYKEKTADNIIWLCEAKIPSTEKTNEKKAVESSTDAAEERLLDKIKNKLRL